MGMCKALAISAAPRGVRVNCVATGVVTGDGSGAIWDKPSNQVRQTAVLMIVPFAKKVLPVFSMQRCSLVSIFDCVAESNLM